MAVSDEKSGKIATLDEAMLHTGFGMFNVVMALLSGLVLMGMIMETMGLSYVIPAAHCDLALSSAQKGWLAAIPFIGIIVTSHMWGWLADTRGRHSVMLLSMAVSAVLSTLSSFAPNLLTFNVAYSVLGIIITSHMWGWLADTRGRRPVMLLSMAVSAVLSTLSSLAPNLLTFALLRFIAAIFISGPSAVCYAYLGEFNSSRHRDRMVAFGAAFVGFGTVVLPAVSWLILPLEFEFPLRLLGISYRPWRLLIVAFALPYAVSAVALIFAPESPKFLLATGRSKETLEVVKRIYAANNFANAEDFPVTELASEGQGTTDENKGIKAVLKSMSQQTMPLFKQPLLSYTCLACFVQFGIFSTANGFYIWFPNILNQMSNHADQHGESATICEVLSTRQQTLLGNSTEILGCDDIVNVATYYKAIMVGLVFCSMYVLVGVLVDYVGKKNILLFVLTVAGACGIAANFVREQDVAISLFGIFQMSGACIGMMTAVVVELFPTNLRAMAVSLSMMAGRVGSVLGSNLIGWLIDVQCSVSFHLFGGLLIVCALLCIALPKSGKPKPLNPV